MNTQVVLIQFLTTYAANTKYAITESQVTQAVKVNMREYSEARTMSALTVLFQSLDGLTHRRFFLINNRFGPEVIFKKWLLIAGLCSILFFTLL